MTKEKKKKLIVVAAAIVVAVAILNIPAVSGRDSHDQNGNDRLGCRHGKDRIRGRKILGVHIQH